MPEGAPEPGGDLSDDVYHPRRAFYNALEEWMQEFNQPRKAAQAITIPACAVSGLG